MKKLFTLAMLLFCLMVRGYSQECPIPPNYFQDPNFEHKLSPLVWTGSWDWISYGAWQPYLTPEFWVTDTTTTHSGSNCLVITADAYIWPGVTTVGFEEKSMKMSFWYKSPVGKMAFWMFFYRDAKLTPEEIRPPLKADLVGADTAYITKTEGSNNEEALYFVLPKAQEWTYFEYKFDYPGSILGPAMTLMFWSEFTAGFIDDVYYGVDFDCIYNGEEEAGLANGDFEASGLGTEWLINAPSGNSTGFLTTDENHTESGSQSMQLWKNFNSTYYMPALGTQGKNMNLNFWHKGNDATLRLNFYEDYGVGTNDFPVPEGAALELDSTGEEIIEVTDTIAASYSIYDHSQILGSTPTGNTITVIDTANVDVTVMNSQDFETIDGPLAPIDDKYSAYYYPDWASVFPKGEFFSPLRSLYLPGDPDWSGVWGSPAGFVDNKAYAFNFMYKGKLQFELLLGTDLKYALDTDPNGLVPANATKSDGAIHWDLDATDWTEFSFAWETNWLADSGFTEPAPLTFKFFGTIISEDSGFVDNLRIYSSVNDIGGSSYVLSVPEVTKEYALDHIQPDTTFISEVVDTVWTLDPEKPLALIWDLPASEDWTPFNLNWTNPEGDIGGTLTMILASKTGAGADSIAYFDDFSFGVPTVVPDIRNKTIGVYPNPASDVLYLKTTVEIERAAFYNSLGQQVKSISKPGSEMNISGLSDGIYILRITAKDGSEYKARFIKK
jgi:hypothetical protein